MDTSPLTSRGISRMRAARGMGPGVAEEASLFSDGEEMHFSAELGREAERLERLERRLASHLGRTSSSTAENAVPGGKSKGRQGTSRKPLASVNGQVASRGREGGVGGRPPARAELQRTRVWTSPATGPDADNGLRTAADEDDGGDDDDAAAAAALSLGPAAPTPVSSLGQPNVTSQDIQGSVGKRNVAEEQQGGEPESPFLAALLRGGRGQCPQEAPPTLLRYTKVTPRVEEEDVGGESGTKDAEAKEDCQASREWSSWEKEREALKLQLKEAKGALEEQTRKESVRKSQEKKAAAKAQKAVGEVASLTASLKAERKAVSELHMRLKEAEQMRTVSEVELRTVRVENERLGEQVRALQNDVHDLREANVRLEVTARSAAEGERHKVLQQLEAAAVKAREQDESIRRLTAALVLAQRDVQNATGVRAPEESAPKVPEEVKAATGAAPSLETRIATLLGDGLLDD